MEDNRARIDGQTLKRQREAKGLSQRQLGAIVAEALASIAPDYDLSDRAMQGRISRIETREVTTTDEAFAEALCFALGLGLDEFDPYALTRGELFVWTRDARPFWIGGRLPLFGSPDEAMDARDVLTESAPGILRGATVEAIGSRLMSPTELANLIGESLYRDVRYDEGVPLPRRVAALAVIDPDDDELREMALWHRALSDDDARDQLLKRVGEPAGRAFPDLGIEPLTLTPDPFELLELHSQAVPSDDALLRLLLDAADARELRLGRVMAGLKARLSGYGSYESYEPEGTKGE